MVHSGCSQQFISSGSRQGRAHGARAYRRPHGPALTRARSISLSTVMGKVKKSKQKHRSGPLSQPASKKVELLPVSARTFSITDHLNAWRLLVVYLVEMCAYSALEASKVVKKRTSEVVKWCNRLWETGSVDDLEKSGRNGFISVTDVEAVKKGLATAAPGTSLKVVMHNLRAEKGIGDDYSVEAMRLKLKDSGWSFQAVKVGLPLSVDTMDARWAFAHKYRDVGLGKCAVFTDSKYFVAGTVDVATKNSGFMSWAPDGEPRRVIKTQGNTYSAHVYGGVCKYGLTDLIFVSGTKGLPDAYTVNRKNPLFNKNDPNCKESEFISQTLSSVTHKEYLDIVMGGGPRSYKGLIKDAQRMFQSNGVQRWYWQQDGAPVHTMADTEKGRATLNAIKGVTQWIVEWPPYSPDLSPIENVWQQVERVLWANYQWNDQKSFQDALKQAWEKVGDDKKFIQHVMASMDRRPRNGDQGGRIHQVIARKGGQTDY